MNEKFIVIQHSNLGENEIEDLFQLCKNMHERTGIQGIVVPEPITILNKKDIQELIVSLKNAIGE